MPLQYLLGYFFFLSFKNKNRTTTPGGTAYIGWWVSDVHRESLPWCKGFAWWCCLGPHSSSLPAFGTWCLHCGSLFEMPVIQSSQLIISWVVKTPSLYFLLCLGNASAYGILQTTLKFQEIQFQESTRRLHNSEDADTVFSCGSFHTCLFLYKQLPGWAGPDQTLLIPVPLVLTPWNNGMKPRDLSAFWCKPMGWELCAE